MPRCGLNGVCYQNFVAEWFVEIVALKPVPGLAHLFIFSPHLYLSF
jgi:hypothetical protein